jgi:putative FmdB family regulatory protein
MPIYEYECDKCGRREEVFHRITDPMEVECDQCQIQMRRLISKSTFKLQGTGWYVTDYGKQEVSQ